MIPKFIKLSLRDTIVYVDTTKIIYMSPANTGDANTVIFFNKEFGISVTETVEQIFTLIKMGNQ